MSDLSVRLAALTTALLVSLAIGLILRSRAGRCRAVAAGPVLSGADLGVPRLGAAATLVQLSSPACAPCCSVAEVLGRVSATAAGVLHIEIDATDRLDLARRLHVMRTPTVLVLDDAGRVISRFSGVATTQQVLSTLPAGARPVAERPERPEGARR